MILDPTQPGALAQAADAVAAGELLGLPTETVYGLAADAENAGAVRRILATLSSCTWQAAKRPGISRGKCLIWRSG